VEDRTFYIDLLFYHLRLHRYFVFELKAGDFEPEYAGKLSFYLAAVNHGLRTPVEGSFERREEARSYVFGDRQLTAGG
jgi:hypothetical protein